MKYHSFICLLYVSLFILQCYSVSEQTSITSQMGFDDTIANDCNLSWPFAGNYLNNYPFSSTFGPRLKASSSYRFDYHRGIDIPRPNGTQLYAVNDALVFRDRISSSGDHYITLKIEHPTTSRGIQGYKYYYPIYRHLNSSVVTEGQTVQKGQLIAYSGQSASGFDHLHFDIAVGSSYQYRTTHPLYYLNYNNSDVPHISKISPSSTYVHTSNKTVGFQVTVDSSELDMIEVSVIGQINNVQYEAVYNFKEENLRHQTSAQKLLLDESQQTLANGVEVEIGLIHHNASNSMKTYYFWFNFSPVINGNGNIISYNLDLTAKDVRGGYEKVNAIGN